MTPDWTPSWVRVVLLFGDDEGQRPGLPPSGVLEVEPGSDPAAVEEGVDELLQETRRAILSAFQSGTAEPR